MPHELNEAVAYKIGRATSEFLKAKTIVVGGDIRLSSPALKHALSMGLIASGTKVIDIGLCGTEEIYFATSFLQADGGIMVTASHNPKDYNGLKLVRENSKPISGDTGLNEIRRLAEEVFTDVPPTFNTPTSCTSINILDAYLSHILGFIDIKRLKPLKLVVNAGNGAAGHVIDGLEEIFDKNNIPIEFIKIQHEPDGNFPNGIPNPLLPECRDATRNAVIQHNADMGIAWDGDFDRCFFFDEKGQFIEGYYIVGLLAEAFLSSKPASKIIHDPRLTWNTIDQVTESNGLPILCKTGHAFIKERMRSENALYGGEMSAHHYFRDFFYCDSGMIPWLLVAELISIKQLPLSSMVAERINRYPSSGEINSLVENSELQIKKILDIYRQNAIEVDFTDGVSIDMGTWRFNLRSSNTEPVLRLNVESRNNRLLMEEKTNELIKLIRS